MELSFFPTEKRDNILLEGNEKKPTSNREIFEYTVKKSKNFIKWLLENKTTNLSPLANSRIPESIVEDSVKTWYEEKVQEDYRKFIFLQPIVETGNGNLSIKEAKIPKISGSEEKNELFWEIVSELYGDESLCKKEHLKDWHKHIGPESEITTWGENIFYKIEDLLEEIQGKEKLSQLTLKGEISTIKWLNKVYSFIIDSKQTEFFNEYKIIPTISGILKFI